MSTLNVPHSIGVSIVHILARGSVAVYSKTTEGTRWMTRGWGVVVDSGTDTIGWVLPDGIRETCGSSSKGRIAWVEPSLQTLSCGGTYLAYWAFELLSCSSHSPCQEGIGACSFSSCVVGDSHYENGDCYPITFYSAASKGTYSFGLNMGKSTLLGEIQGKQALQSSVRPLVLNDTRPPVVGDQFSFLIDFDGTDTNHGRVSVFRNLKPLGTFEHVETKLPMFPTVHMCCRDAKYRFIRNPPLPSLFSLFG
ncbi:hypothetical protein Pelo_18958 [Pelomyxa schiedti]|nr:hypothetical protein Pelo_18958 [Pelomyxa schiedti]